MRRATGWRFAAAALLAPLLGGCVAMAALPVLAGGAMAARSEIGGAQQEAGAADSGAEARTAGEPHPDADHAGDAALAARPAASAAPGRGTGDLAAGNMAGAAPAGPLPAAWSGFVSYALEQSARTGQGKTASVLLERLPSLTAPRFRECPSATPAVMIDLDPGKDGRISPTRISAPPGLAEGLAQLRAAGIVVIWLSAQPADHLREIGDALQRSGLDPAGRDPLVLSMQAEDRRQKLREKAAADGCVIAIAGDRRGDFDEVFDYLRNPADATLLDAKLGQGWFLVPPFN